jgi:hypothetical protein
MSDTKWWCFVFFIMCFFAAITPNKNYNIMKANYYKQKNIACLTALASLFGCLNSFSQNTATWPSSGSVGIGTDAPAQLLHVVGKTRFDVANQGSGGGRFFFTRPLLSNFENLISFGTNGTSTYDWVMGTSNSSPDFLLGGWTATNAFKILAANGNVGIGMGSLAPLTKLQVGGSALFSQSVSGIISAPMIRPTAAYSGATTPDYTWYNNDQTGMYHPVANAIAFSSGGVEKMRVHSNGYVGIGTNNPAGPLEVKDNSGKSFIFYGNGVGDLQSTGSFRPHFATGTDFTIFEGNVGSGTARMQINNSGDFTINKLAGTGLRTVLVDATGKLVPGTATSAGTVNWALGGNPISNPASEWLGTSSNQPIHFYTNGGKRMSLTKEGRVVIGYEYGGEDGQLNINAFNEAGIIRLNSSTYNGTGNKDAGLYISNQAGGTELVYDATGFSHLNWNTRKTISFREESVLIGPLDPNNSNGNTMDINTKLMISTKTINGYTPIPFRIVDPALAGPNRLVYEILPDGTTHIGNTKPSIAPYVNAKLSVDGSVVAREIFVCDQVSAGWADYVFNKDYKLMPLADVESYVKENKHLPNVPSAKEIEEKGQGLGKLQVVQMEKIEEAFLYILELKKEVDALKAENNELKKLYSNK